LRKHQDHKETYLSKAQQVEDELALPERSKSIACLGARDTFAFEERHFLRKCVDALLASKLSEARQILTSRQGAIWLTNDERLAEWTVAERALELLESAENATPPTFLHLETLIHAYASTFRDLDRRHRELEQAVAARHEDDDILDQLIATARSKYLKVAGILQAEFVRLVQQDGWPVSGGKLLRNSQIFDRQVAPLLEAGHRVAYLLIDSLRYELAVELEKQLSEKNALRLHTVCAQLPTYTEVGMAILSYRQGKTDKITSRRPVLDLAWSQVDAFADEQEIEVAIEAVDSKGNIVGFVGSGQTVNPATQGVRIRPGLIVNVGLRMEDNFSGTFTVRALDPATQAIITDITLKTAYLE
jgi:hypothetical protein